MDLVGTARDTPGGLGWAFFIARCEVARPWYRFWEKDESNVVSIEKAKKPEEMPEPKSYTFDPVWAGSEYIGEAPTEHHPGTAGLSYGTLHNMARTPVIASILNTRIQQLAEFASVQTSPYGIGFRIKMRDIRQKMTPAAQRRAQEIEKVIMRSGGKYGIGGFEPFLRAVVRDSLVYDQCNFEVLKNRGGGIVGYVPVDASTMRRARPTEAELARGRVSADSARYVQMIDNKIVNEYESDELAWGVRRPRTWIYANGYGYPELEELMRIVTYLLNAETYNSVNFTNGIHASTILALKASLTNEQFRTFKRELNAMMHGPANAKRMPLVLLDPRTEAKQELTAVNLSQSNKEMEYTQWNSYLIKICCSIYSMDPAELGFVFGNEGQTSTITANGPSDRITASKERGLRPMLRALESWINHWLVEPMDEDFCIDFVGFDAKTEEQKVDLDIKALKAFKTINEIRSEHDMEPIDDQLGNLILEPSFLQVYMQTMMAEGQEEMPGEEPGQAEGEEGEEGGEYQDLWNEGQELLAAGEPEEAAEKALSAVLTSTGGDMGGATEALAKAVAAGVREGLLNMDGIGSKDRWVPVTDKNNNIKAVAVEV